MLSDRELLTAVQSAADDFIVYGELGRVGDSLAALLARQRTDQQLVVLMVQSTTTATGETELSVEVKQQLDARIPDGGTKCPACGATLRPWVRFCTRCGHDVTGRGAVTPQQRAELREAVRAAVEADYEFLGEIRRSEGGGDVFFARERATGRIAALRLNQSQGDGEFELGETNILRKAPPPVPSAPGSDRPLVSVTQLLRKLDPEPTSSMRGARAGSSGASSPYPAHGADAHDRTAAPQSSHHLEQQSSASSGGGALPPRAMLIAGGVLVATIAILAILVLR